MKTFLCAVCIFVLTGNLAFSQSGPLSSPPNEAKLLTIVRSDAPQDQKANALRQLGQIGTRKAVPALAGLLGDEKLAHMARYALEQIPDPQVTVALRQAVPTLRGRTLAGALMSLGARPSPAGTRPSDEQLLARYLRDPDLEVASAAAYSIGRLGTTAAARALEAALPGAPEAARPALWDGLLRCADRLTNVGSPQAAAVYDRLRNSNAPLHIRAAAARGSVLARGNAGIPLLVQLLQDSEPAMFTSGLGLTQELAGTETTRSVASLVPRLHANKRARVIQALGNRGDTSALPEVRVAAKQAEPEIRAAAIIAIAQLRDAASLPILIEAATSENGNVASAAINTIFRLPGKSVDEALIGLVAGMDQSRSLMAISCLARRRTPEAKPALFKAAREGQTVVRLAAMNALAEISNASDIAPITALLLNASSAPEMEAAEKLLVHICVTSSDKAGCADKLANALPTAKTPQKVSLLRVLEAIGGPKPLQTMRDALRDPSVEVQETAVRAMCNWSNSEAAADLLVLARDSANPARQALALRGYIRMAGDETVDMDRRLEMCREVLPLIRRDDEKRLWLSALGAIPSPHALAMIAPLIDDPAVREEACVAAVATASKLLRLPDASRPEFKPQLAAIADTLKKAQASTKNSQLPGDVLALQTKVKELRGKD